MTRSFCVEKNPNHLADQKKDHFPAIKSQLPRAPWWVSASSTVPTGLWMGNEDDWSQLKPQS